MDLHPKHDRNSHAYIPPRFWAVSRDQILYFRSVVKKGVDKGMITLNSAHHDEGHTEADFKKERYGPSMYEVSEQCIMPVTRHEGMASTGPCGRTRTGCVATFSKSTRRVRACMSSSTNCFPQPLRKTPTPLSCTKHVADTPFHQALSVLRCMVVVPNHQCSIYTRLWCVCEAFVAISMLGEKEMAIQIQWFPRS